MINLIFAMINDLNDILKWTVSIIKVHPQKWAYRNLWGIGTAGAKFEHSVATTDFDFHLSYNTRVL